MRRVKICLLPSLTPASPADPAALENQVLQHVNRERRSRGLSALHLDPQLTTLTRRHSRNMADRRFFSHHDPARAAVRAWMKSPGHRANLLGKMYTRTGIGIDNRRGSLSNPTKSPNAAQTAPNTTPIRYSIACFPLLLVPHRCAVHAVGIVVNA